jgi:hypothetical protein
MPRIDDCLPGWVKRRGDGLREASTGQLCALFIGAGTTLCHIVHGWTLSSKWETNKSCDYPIMVRLRPRNLTCFIYRVT